MRNAFFYAFFFTFLNQIIWQKNDWFASSLEESCFSWLTLKHCNEWISLQSSITQKVIITRSTVFHHPQGMRGCHNNGDIMAGCHYEVSTWQGVPTNCSECLPQLETQTGEREMERPRGWEKEEREKKTGKRKWGEAYGEVGRVEGINGRRGDGEWQGEKERWGEKEIEGAGCSD